MEPVPAQISTEAFGHIRMMERKPIERKSRRAEFLLVLLLLVPASADADEAVQVGTLLASPMTYDRQQVRVTGVVSGHRMEKFIQQAYRRVGCTQRFTLTDEAGAIDAIYEPLCPVVILQNGDRATIDAQFWKGSAAIGTLNVWAVTKR